MTVMQLYKEGHLTLAIQALGDEVRSNPLDTRRRTFLFELLCFAGLYDRAEKQLDFLAGANEKAAAGALLYRSALQAERTRQELFAKHEYPESSALSESVGGELDGVPFTNILDADPRIGANIEVFIAGSYTWIPIKYMEMLSIEKPETLRDLLWARARVTTTAAFRLQDLGEVLIPVLSPASSKSADEAVQLGRMTVWHNDAGQQGVPLGQRMLLVDGEEIPLLGIGTIQWNKEADGAIDASA